jgi:hypothetical protein
MTTWTLVIRPPAGKLTVVRVGGKAQSLVAYCGRYPNRFMATLARKRLLRTAVKQYKAGDRGYVPEITIEEVNPLRTAPIEQEEGS